MNTLAKLIFILALLITILMISFKLNRTIVFDYTSNIDVDSEHNQTSNTLTSTNTTYTSIEDNLSALSTNSTTTSLDEKANTQSFSDEGLSATSNILIPSLNSDLNNTLTNLALGSSENSELVYSEITEFERAVRKYISRGYKISTLNTQNIRNAGLIDEELSQKYDVTFKVANDGYDIIIILRYPLAEGVKTDLLKKPRITLKGETIQYTFWIKAYR